MLFDWDEANVAHIARHGVTSAEVEEVLQQEFLVELPEQTRNGEIRLAQIGSTGKGRVLVVITTERGDLVRPVTAFDASARQRMQLRELMVTYAAEIADPELLQ